MKRLFAILFALCSLADPACAAGDEVAYAAMGDSPPLPYLLTRGAGSPQFTKPAYGVILMPGGLGVLEPRTVKGRLAFRAGGDFLIRSRLWFTTGPFVAASTDATNEPGPILAIAADLKKRFGPLAVYVIGTSRSTEATMRLAAPLDGQVAGFVHTSSMNAIASFDPRRFTSRHLMVMHKLDACRVTLPSNSEAAHRSFGTELIVMAGGKSEVEACDPRAYHGYNGIERETVDRIKAWIAAGK
ncbi:MAG TPA: hypothetical protein VLA02_01385 [Reyranella sp.]|nr:hypothetical protein [Reyranella sp.]